jgi:hypothetical protein
LLEPKDPLSGFWAGSPSEGADKSRYRKYFGFGIPIMCPVEGINYRWTLLITRQPLVLIPLVHLNG